MTLHIGNNNSLNLKDIIGIFNIKTLEKNEECNNFKTLVVCEKENYYSNISTDAINKRITTEIL